VAVFARSDAPRSSLPAAAALPFGCCYGRGRIHDATNNFKLYRRDFLNNVRTESTGGFELGLELTVRGCAAVGG
jgi:hypothetical protein